MERAAAVFAEHERRIHERLPNVEVRHTGGTSVRGVLTTGDVDLHVRTDRCSFDAAREALSDLYRPLYLDAWHAEGAFFVAPASYPPVEVALTVVGILDDLHHGEAWNRIAADAALRVQYNALKHKHEGSSLSDYLVAKRDFFRENFAV
jgi:GrpB-like predicted nucleotidyltransferase (UPF0157 family)